jgi:hypothetical protein
MLYRTRCDLVDIYLLEGTFRHCLCVLKLYNICLTTSLQKHFVSRFVANIKIKKLMSIRKIDEVQLACL